MSVLSRWVIAYDAHALEQKAVLITSPASKESGIWASDTGRRRNESGTLFVATGKREVRRCSRTGLWRHAVKLNLENHSLLVRDYFTPRDQGELNAADNDLAL